MIGPRPLKGCCMSLSVGCSALSSVTTTHSFAQHNNNVLKHMHRTTMEKRPPKNSVATTNIVQMVLSHFLLCVCMGECVNVCVCVVCLDGFACSIEYNGGPYYCSQEAKRNNRIKTSLEKSTVWHLWAQNFHLMKLAALFVANMRVLLPKQRMNALFFSFAPLERPKTVCSFQCIDERRVKQRFYINSLII